MPPNDRVHDRVVLDALEAIEPIPFTGNVWRVTRQGRDPLRGSSANGRWSAPGEFEVLYTSLEKDGALAEIGHRLSLEPVWPSRLRHSVHCIRVTADKVLQLSNMEVLRTLGVDVERYSSYEYGSTQAIAAAAHFLDFSAIVVPNARFDCNNLVAFVGVIEPGALESITSEDVDWEAWRRSRRAKPTP